MKRHGLLSPEKAKKIERRAAELQRLHDSGRWRKVLAAARADSQALRTEIDEVNAEAVRRAAAARERRRRVHSAARTVADALAADGKAIPDDLLDAVSRALRGDG